MLHCVPCACTKQAFKVLTSQKIKGMVCKAFKVYRHLKPRSTVNETIAMAMETMKTCGDDNSATVTMQEEEDETKEWEWEWEVEVDCEVFITFISQPHGGNLLKKIRFSKEQFNGTKAKMWWIDNYDRITELYSVEKTNPPWESTSVSTEDALIAPSCSPEMDPILAPNSCDSMHTARPMLSTEISSMESFAMSSDSDFEEEWDEEDEREPGVSLTIRSYRDGTRKIMHVYFRFLACSKFFPADVLTFGRPNGTCDIVMGPTVPCTSDENVCMQTILQSRKVQ